MKVFLNKTNLQKDVINKLKESKHSEKFKIYNFEIIIKDEGIAKKKKIYNIYIKRFYNDAIKRMTRYSI